MKGYIYNTEQEAIEARKLSADYKGLPINPNDIINNNNNKKNN